MVIFFLTGCQPSQDTQKSEPIKVTIGEQAFDTSVADTPALRTQGLSFIEYLAENTGMLFVFDEVDYQRFWMKDTFLPLDLIWISEDLEVQHVKTLEPCATDITCPTYGPFVKSKYVLEVNAGEFKGVIGDSVILDPN